MPRVNPPKRRASSPVAGPLRPAGIRHINSREIFWLLRANSPCSRADLVRLSGLSAPTVSATVEHLEKRGLVATLGLGVSAGGRPPGLISLNPECAYVAGMEITSTVLHVVLADLEGNRIGKATTKLLAAPTPEKVVDALAQSVTRLLAQHSIPREKLYAVCAAAPGITDRRAGTVLSAPHLPEWENVPLKRLLEEAIGIQAVVENNVNLSALGERMEGAARGQDDFVFLWMGDGVGAGVFVDGKLHRGAIGSAGEIGYMRVPGAPRGAVSIHTTGSLEDVVGEKGIAEAWRRLRSEKSEKIKDARGATEILALAETGDVDAIQIRDSIAAILSDVLINIAVLLDPAMIILGGDVGRSAALFGAVLKRVQQDDFARFVLVASQLGNNAALSGAVKLSLEAAEAELLAGSIET